MKTIEKLEKSIYPLTIVCDRYNGTYSGGKYLAFGLDHWDLPEEIGGGDPVEDYFFNVQGHEKYVIGKGETPQEALRDLTVKLHPNIEL